MQKLFYTRPFPGRLWKSTRQNLKGIFQENEASSRHDVTSRDTRLNDSAGPVTLARNIPRIPVTEVNKLHSAATGQRVPFELPFLND